MPLRPAHPTLSAAHVLDHHRDIAPGGLRRLALDAEAGIEQRIIGRRQRLRFLPRHRAVAVCLAGRRCDDTGRVAELGAVKREHVLKYQLRRIGAAFDVEADHVKAFSKESFGPSA